MERYRRRVGDTRAGVAKDFLIGGAYRLHEERPKWERRNSSPQILMGLYREMYQYSIEANIRYWYAAMERSLLRALARFQFVFRPIGMETNYYGPVTPYVADLRELEQRLGASNPDLLAWFRAGL
jgi:N-acyl amino acid synthase of PEP-CTERM/exosortase system